MWDLRATSSGRVARPSPAGTLHVVRAILGRFLGGLPLLARDDVGRVPIRPVVLRGGWFVLAVALLGFAQEIGQRRDVEAAQPASRKPGGDLLQQPAVAVGIAERDPRAVGAPLRIRARQAALRPGDTESAVEMEDLARVGAVGDELGACGLDVVDDEERSLNRARRGGREALPDEDGAR